MSEPYNNTFCYFTGLKLGLLGRTQIKGVWEQRGEGNIWIEEEETA